MVLRVNAMVDTMMKDIEITATTCEKKEGGDPSLNTEGTIVDQQRDEKLLKKLEDFCGWKTLISGRATEDKQTQQTPKTHRSQFQPIKSKFRYCQILKSLNMVDVARSKLC